jgi:precorrin-6A synthase
MSTRALLIIGIGVGHPEQLTIQAIEAMNRADVFFVMDKGGDKQALVEFRKQVCERYIRAQTYRVVEVADPPRDPTIASYGARVEAWHAQRADSYARLIREELAEGQCGAFLVWGDPSLYDSTLRILDQVTARGSVAFELEVIPGITSVQALAASHRIALNHIGGPVHVTTGRQLRSQDTTAQLDNVVVMLDGECSWKQLGDPELFIYWGAYLGTAHELLVSGRLRDCAERIEQLRSEARARHGWIMDTYLLRKDPAA